MLINEVHIDATNNLNYGDSGKYKTFTDDVGELFIFLRKEHGRCISRIYVDGLNGTCKAIGWVFEKRVRYEDSKNTYLRHIWVSLFEKEDLVQTTEYPIYLN